MFQRDNKNKFSLVTKRSRLVFLLNRFDPLTSWSSWSGRLPSNLDRLLFGNFHSSCFNKD